MPATGLSHVQKEAGNLNAAELRKLRAWLDKELEHREHWRDHTFRLEYVACGKEQCRCKHGGKGHGPYWYEYWREGNRIRKKYHGKNLPPWVEAAEVEQTAHDASGDGHTAESGVAAGRGRRARPRRSPRGSAKGAAVQPS